MKFCNFCFIACLTLFLSSSCKENVTDNEIKTGTLVFEAVHSISSKKIAAGNFDLKKGNEKNSNTFKMHTLNLKLTVTDIWVSKGVVKQGNKDDLEWIKIGENSQLKFFDEYKFTVNNIPAGEYKSVKINFKNIFYRFAAYQSDPTQKIEMKERMGLEDETDKWIGSCEDETSLAPTNYFSPFGNHNLKNGSFVLVNSKELIGGFEIKAGTTTKLYWKMGDEREFDPYACTFDWIDENNNGVWDCGVDRMDNFECNINPPLEKMWCFIVKYN